MENILNNWILHLIWQVPLCIVVAIMVLNKMSPETYGMTFEERIDAGWRP